MSSISFLYNILVHILNPPTDLQLAFVDCQENLSLLTEERSQSSFTCCAHCLLDDLPNGVDIAFYPKLLGT